MSKKSVDEIISMAKNISNQAANAGEAAAASPELMDAIQSVAAQIKRSAGADSGLAALVDQVQGLPRALTKSECPMSLEIRNCQFRFECPKTWDSLTKTSTSTVRFCDQCRRNVHYCKTPTELHAAMVKNQCVAVEIKATPKRPRQLLLGDLMPPPYN